MSTTRQGETKVMLIFKNRQRGTSRTHAQRVALEHRSRRINRQLRNVIRSLHSCPWAFSLSAHHLDSSHSGSPVVLLRLTSAKPETTRRMETPGRLWETDSGRMDVGLNVSMQSWKTADLFHRAALRGFGFINMQMDTRAAQSIYSKQSTWPNVSWVCLEHLESQRLRARCPFERRWINGTPRVGWRLTDSLDWIRPSIHLSIQEETERRIDEYVDVWRGWKPEQGATDGCWARRPEEAPLLKWRLSTLGLNYAEKASIAGREKKKFW